jgi:hypothetical protein
MGHVCGGEGLNTGKSGSQALEKRKEKKKKKNLETREKRKGGNPPSFPNSNNKREKCVSFISIDRSEKEISYFLKV